MKFVAYIVRRTIASAFAVLGALCLIFFVSHVLPGNPVLSRATGSSLATIHQIEQQLGLNRPLGVQFADYFSGLAHGNLGESYSTGRPVALI